NWPSGVESSTRRGAAMPGRGVVWQLVVVLGLGVAPASTPDAAWQAYTDAGWQAVAAGRHDEAEKLFRAALETAQALDGQDRRRPGRRRSSAAWARSSAAAGGRQRPRRRTGARWRSARRSSPPTIRTSP